MTSRLSRIAAGSVLLLTLAACGTETTGSGTTTTGGSSTWSSTSAPDSATSSEATSTSTSSTTSSSTTSSSTTSASSTDTPTTASTGSTEPAQLTREILLNPKAADGSIAADWTATPISNPCGTNIAPPDASPFAKGKGVFTCGPNAANLLACWTFPANKVGCIQGTEQLGRKLVTFTANLSYTGAGEPNPAPIQVELTDGTVCSTVGHDSANHWQGRNGWLYCKDGRMLLAKGEGTTSGYFDKTTGLWTAQAVPQQGVVAPKTVTVASATYAQGS